jgi:hypothetical protein
MEEDADVRGPLVSRVLGRSISTQRGPICRWKCCHYAITVLGIRGCGRRLSGDRDREGDD